MKSLFERPEPEAATCSEAMEEALNLYMDGELPFAEQPLLFTHLAACDRCRCIMGAMLEFRRMSRQEVLSVPSVVDEAIFERLNQVKKRSNRIDRYRDRRPLWQIRASMSLRAAALAAVMLFGAGLMFPQDIGSPLAVKAVVAQEEPVEEHSPILFPQVIYGYHPGLTVEAPRFDEPTVSDAY